MAEATDVRQPQELSIAIVQRVQSAPDLDPGLAPETGGRSRLREEKILDLLKANATIELT